MVLNSTRGGKSCKKYSLRKIWADLMKTLLWVISTLAILFLVGCHSRQLGGRQVIPIGVIMPLSGNAASLGKPALDAIRLAVDSYNAQNGGSRPLIKLIAEDSQAAPSRAVSAFLKLATVNKVWAVLGPLTSGGTLAVAPLANRDHVVILSPGASSPAITQAGQYVFRNELSEAYGAAMAAKIAYNRLRFRTLGVLFINNDYGLGTADVFQKSFKQLGGRISASEAFNPGTTDFRTALIKIATTKPDAMFVVFQDEIVNILRQRSQLRIGIPVYTTPVFEDPNFLKQLGVLADGVMYAYYGSFNPHAQTGAMSKFIRSYKVRYGTAPTYYAALGYDAANILITALKSGDFRRSEIVAALHNIRDFPGVTGQTSFDQNGDVSKPVVLKTVRNGRYEQY